MYNFWFLPIFCILLLVIWITGKYFLSFSMLSLHSSNCFLCWAEFF
jgi:hypothetical protein